jgi:ubiquinone biosynthesis protein COQ9
MKIRARITHALRLRLELQTKHREAVRKLVSFYALPHHAHHSLRACYATVDNIWHAIGDTSTDFNFYTKRLTLAAVYSSTLLIWLSDESLGQQATWDFLDRRIENVMQIEKAKSQVKNWLGKARFS